MMRRAVLAVFLSFPMIAAAEEPALRLTPGGKAVEVAGLPAADLTALAKLKGEAEVWPKVLAVFVDKNDRTAPAMLGTWSVEGKTLCFVPRFPLVPGLVYRVVYDPAQTPGHAAAKPIEAKLSLPKPAPKAAAAVIQVYPTAKMLPENQLKFYVHFSAPMSHGDNYQYLSLLDAEGKVVDHPFLELGEELWDPESRRFTLFIDPGRIKQGLKPREEFGPVLVEGKRYTLVIDRAWTDGEGNPLKETYRKTFTVGTAVDMKVDPKEWKLQAPSSGREPLTVVFPRPLDHALLNRLVWVVDEKDNKVVGSVVVGDEEKRWRFIPKQQWTAGKYRLVADTRLEDLAGNNIARPFEVDVLRPVEREVKVETVSVPFEVRASVPR